jgi:Protein of unknown function (DUF4232)
MTDARPAGKTALAAALAALAIAAGATACSGAASPPGSGNSSAGRQTPARQAANYRSPSPAAATQASPSATAQQPGGSPPQGSAATGCAPGALHLAIGPASATAGSVYYALQFTNVSATTCTMDGYPGVTFVASPGGDAIGGPAVRDPTFAGELVTLAPGTMAHASLQVAIAANYPAHVCDPATAHWLQVYPPNQYTALYVPFTAQTCTGSIPTGSTLGIYVVRPGATGL